LVELRRLQAVGNYSLSVSLPREWVRRHGLRKGDLVVLEAEKDGSLRISPVKEESEALRVFTVNADRCVAPNMLKRILVGCYILGYESVKVLSSTRLRQEHVEEVNSVLRRLMGVGVMEESMNHLVLQSIMEPSKFPVENLLHRLHSLSLLMQRVSLQAYMSRDKSLAEDVIRLEKDSDMLYWLILRQLELASHDPKVAKKVGVEDLPLNWACRSVAKSLESIADGAERLCNLVLQLAGSLSEEPPSDLKTMGETSLRMHEEAFKAFVKKDVELANEAIESLKQLREIELSLYSRVTGYRGEMAAYIVMAAHYVRETAVNSARIGEAAINLALATSEAI